MIVRKLFFLLKAAIFVLAFSFALATALPLQAAGIASIDTKVTLKDAVIVEGNYILLGDLFTNAGPKADTRVAYAPKPGRRSHFDAKWLYRVARAYGLKWRPLTLKTRAIVERSSQEIFRDEIEDALTASFQDQGYRDKFEVELGNRSLKIYVAANEPATIGVENLSINRSTGRFVATLVTPANKPGAKRYRLTGRVHRLVQVPVISRRISRGEIIRKNDIEWIDVREYTLRRGFILDDSQVIGMAAKRYIAAKTPISASQIQRPQLVSRGDLVTVSLQAGQMSLKTQGRAIEAGSLGDVVRVKNSKSKKVVETRVTGKGTVKVSLLRATALN
ncbi:MAG: flagellar basal body P-ring formation protein FlgA [Rhodospirillaceae bacterium]|nr:flagellar basal body P-ring formation protein FlgA [Rhodospirillaceae bacterium]